MRYASLPLPRLIGGPQTHHREGRDAGGHRQAAEPFQRAEGRQPREQGADALLLEPPLLQESSAGDGSQDQQREPGHGHCDACLNPRQRA